LYDVHWLKIYLKMKNEEILSDLFLIIVNKNELVKYDNKKIYIFDAFVKKNFQED